MDASSDPRDQRIAELEAEVAQLRAEIGRRDEEDRRRGQRHGLTGLGRTQAEVPVQPIRDHVLGVMHASALSAPQVAELAGIPGSTVENVLYDRNKKTVRTGIAEKLLTVTASARLPERGNVPATGTSRRLQALSAAGHPLRALAGRAGITYGHALQLRDGERVSTTSATARAVRALYGDLQLGPPQDTRGERIAVAKTRSHAAAHGYAPAGAWDDDEIDDPDARPRWEWVRSEDDGKRRYGAKDELAEDLRGLTRLGGTSLAEAANHLGISEEYAATVLRRHPETHGEAA